MSRDFDGIQPPPEWLPSWTKEDLQPIADFIDGEILKMVMKAAQSHEEFIATLKPDTAYMEVPRCDQCRWWEREADGSPLFDDGRSHCLRPAVSGGLMCSADEIYAYITTHAAFGCVQFEAKQEPERK